jgi:uncharacterized protein (TIGR03435 family)
LIAALIPAGTTAGLLAIMAVSLGTIGAAQTRVFESASVKQASGNDGVRGGCHGIDSKYSPNQLDVPPTGGCVITNARLSHLIMIAWGMSTTSPIRSEPDWIARGGIRYTVEARSGGERTEAQLLEMLRNLVIERFRLKFHRETIEKPGFVMAIGKDGPRLKTATALQKDVDMYWGNPAARRPQVLTLKRCTIGLLADILTSQEHEAFVDETGLKDEYDFSLSWSGQFGPSLADAMREQLGIELRRQVVAISLFVVDSSQRAD